MAKPFVSPFNELGRAGRLEEVSGTMQCHVCYINVGDGTYDQEKKILSYVCPQGHENKLEGYELE